MDTQNIQMLVEEQRAYFNSGKTLSASYRIKMLKRLRACIIKSEKEINEALKKDLGKSEFESYMCETGMTLSEISHMIKHVRCYMGEKTRMTPLVHFASRSYQKPSPKGVVLIMSPWNYPFMLTMEPLVDALAAGNTAIVKPSAYSPHTSAVIGKIIRSCFSPEQVAVVTGGRAENCALLDQKFDHIFFTGSIQVGKEVMEKAAKHLTPVTLELGGKSPCIVDETANLKLSAKRIVFGKFLNLGQTCVAPDYILCHSKVKEQLIREIKTQIVKQFGQNPMENANYGKIINEKHFDRILSLIDNEKVVYGGRYDANTCRIMPTVMDNVTFEDAVMQQEIFGPVLPVLTFDTIEEVIDIVQKRPHPLALYFFSRSRKNIRKVTSRCGFGGGCINDTIIHLATSSLPFGGFGESGMGGYHGIDGFRTFSHYKSIVDKKLWLDLPMRYQPYNKLFEKIVRLFLR